MNSPDVCVWFIYVYRLITTLNSKFLRSFDQTQCSFTNRSFSFHAGGFMSLRVYRSSSCPGSWSEIARHYCTNRGMYLNRDALYKSRLTSPDPASETIWETGTPDCQVHSSPSVLNGRYQRRYQQGSARAKWWHNEGSNSVSPAAEVRLDAQT